MKIYNEFADWFHLLTHPSDTRRRLPTTCA